MGKRFVYMKVSKPPLELPEVVADSPTELANITGTNINTINQSISKSYHGRLNSRWIKVEIDDEDDE